jgi:mannose-6-phosphate isomerase-like protein (cupin superfamily)
MVGELKIEKQSKKIVDLKKGDSLWINGKEMKIDNHFLFMAHKDTNEMIIEVYNPENEREYQVRYFDDQIETSIEVFELVEDFEYVRREPKTIEW